MNRRYRQIDTIQHRTQGSFESCQLSRLGRPSRVTTPLQFIFYFTILLFHFCSLTYIHFRTSTFFLIQFNFYSFLGKKVERFLDGKWIDSQIDRQIDRQIDIVKRSKQSRTLGKVYILKDSFKVKFLDQVSFLFQK